MYTDRRSRTFDKRALLRLGIVGLVMVQLCFPSVPIAASGTTLLGNETILTNHDYNPDGVAEVFLYTASAGGTVNRLSIYLDGASTATQVIVGIYQNTAGDVPGDLLTQAIIASPVNGAWNMIPVPDATITAGAKYWIAVLGPTGVGIVRFRDTGAGGKAQTSAQTNLTTLPTTWSPGITYSNSPMSAYAVQWIGGDTTPPAISAVAAGNITATGATIAWITDESATSQVEYGTTTAYGALTTLDAALVTSHSRQLTALTPGTTYHYRVISRDETGNIATSLDFTFTTANPGGTGGAGQWSAAMNWPLVAVHSTVLSSGEVLVWDAWEYGGTSSARLWNPSTQTFTSVPNIFSQLFCAGHAALPDGRLLVIGGHNGGEVGIKDTNIFDPATRSWTRAANMSYARWYPSAVTLGDGRVVALSGQITPGVFADTPEVFDPATGGWSQLSQVRMDVHEPEYLQAVLLPNGKIFIITPLTRQMRTLDVATQTWTDVGLSPVFNSTSVMYRPGKFLVAGGGDPVQTTTAVLDMNQATPIWRQTAPMAYPRYQHNLVVLPDGKVLAIGGSTINSIESRSGVLPAELWDPATETWTTVASMRDLRMYHSTAVLLPDGRVLAAGGGRYGRGINYPTAEIYSPANLSNGPRPTITSMPSTVGYGATVAVQTPDAADIGSVSFIRLPSNTHTLDMDQRYMELGFTRTANGLTVQTPTDANTAPPGKYMLFVISSQGVPSVAKIVQIGGPSQGDVEPPTVSVTAPESGASVSGSAVAISAAAADNTGVASVQFLLDDAPLGPPLTNGPYSMAWDSTTVANGSHTLSAQARDAAGNVGTATAVAITVANGDTTPPTVTGGSPANGATGVAVASSVTATFSEALDPASVTTSAFTLTGPGGAAVAAAVAYDPATRVATLTPSAPLAGGTTYTATVRSGGADPRVKDLAGNALAADATWSFDTAVADTTPPVISSVTFSSVTATGATIGWATNESATSQVEYGTTPAYGASSTLDPALITNHSQALTGLNANTTYNYRVVSRDAAGNIATSDNFTFTTSAATAVKLIGAQAILPHLDYNPAGVAEAFQYTANASGNITKLYIYVDASSTATKIVVGLYTNTATGNNPGTLLVQATITAPVAGTWNAVAIPATSVTAGTTYWIAVLGPAGSGTVRFRDTGSGGKAQTSSQTNLTALPATWTRGTNYFNSPMSAYGVQEP